MTPCLAIAALLIGCAGDPDPAPDTGPDAPTPYEYERPELEPSLNAAEVEAAVRDLAPGLLRIDPYPLYDAYALALMGQEQSCPGTYPIAGVIGWGNECTARSGWSYAGRSQALAVHHETIDGVYYDTFGSLLTDAVLTSPDGYDLEIIGYGDLWDRPVDGGAQAVWVYFLGVFRSAFPEHADTWLAEDLSVAVTAESWAHPEQGRWLRLDGGASPIEGDRATLTARDLLLYSPETGTTCATEPAGELVYRTHDGEAYTLRFDGPASPEDAVSADLCDGCGTVWFEGAALGEACVDLTALTDWETRPW
ncbi:MAG: hypothetical protein H6739_07910 [Alphaproteobacteria bacterium]|nr:hypothetical protein [Alphaproteobacteria bacterium]